MCFNHRGFKQTPWLHTASCVCVISNSPFYFFFSPVCFHLMSFVMLPCLVKTVASVRASIFYHLIQGQQLLDNARVHSKTVCQSVAEPGKLHVIIPTLSMKVFPGFLLVATAWQYQFPFLPSCYRVFFSTIGCCFFLILHLPWIFLWIKSRVWRIVRIRGKTVNKGWANILFTSPFTVWGNEKKKKNLSRLDIVKYMIQ